MLEYGKLYKSLQTSFESIFSIDEIKEIIGAVLEVQTDTPISTGKKLVLSKLIIKGEKSNGTAVDFVYPLNTGVNMLIADNLKGKSSVFKMIKYAITGSNSIKKDVKKWINSIALGFSINNKEYYIDLNLSNRVLEGRLYNGSIEDYHVGHLYENEEIFCAVGEDDYTEKIQDFFFNQFSYYSLKWTQKSSSKTEAKLLTASASWKTYFKSIYLESKDSSTMMYGSQGKKVFQMLLGLELTYAINRLTILKEKYEFDTAIEGIKNDEKQLDKLHSTLAKNLIDVNDQLDTLQAEIENSYGLKKLYSHQHEIQEKLYKMSNLRVANSKEMQLLSNRIEKLSLNEQSLKSEHRRIKREINKTQRHINDIFEYLEAGAFFSNLEIKHCPSCDSEVKNKPIQSREDVLCPLCQKPRCNNDFDDKEKFEKRIDTQKLILKSYEDEICKIENTLTSISNEKQDFELEMNSIDERLLKLNSSNIENELESIESKIETSLINSTTLTEKENDLRGKIAVLEYRINELSNLTSDEGKNNIVNKINLIEAAISELSITQYEKSRNIFEKLENMMLEELHQFGLSSITEIKITPNFDIKYKQGGDYIGFNEIAEGEQLRAKIAFYLGIIQLDIAKNYGRHARLLIIDSPNKEEGDTMYLSGLKEVLMNINNRYADNLQILIGTATRELANVTKSQTIFEEGEFVF